MRPGPGALVETSGPAEVGVQDEAVAEEVLKPWYLEPLTAEKAPRGQGAARGSASPTKSPEVPDA
eukprot:4683836-Alexandrium_andersonii.AAC.1